MYSKNNWHGAHQMNGAPRSTPMPRESEKDELPEEMFGIKKSDFQNMRKFTKCLEVKIEIHKVCECVRYGATRADRSNHSAADRNMYFDFYLFFVEICCVTRVVAVN